MIGGTNILVCTDFSTSSDLALKAAKVLSVRSHASLHLLHVCEYPMQLDWAIDEGMSNYFNEKFEIDLIRSSKERLDEQMHRLGVNGKAHVTLGLPFQSIHSLIKELDIGVLVIGHKGRGKTLFHLGGLAVKMISSSPVPVFVVKNEMHTDKVAGLLDPNGSIKEIIVAAEELASVLSSRIEFVSLVSDLAARYIGVGKVGFSTSLLTLSEHQKNEMKKVIKDRIRKELQTNSHAEIKVEVSIEKKIAYHLNSILTDDHTDIAVMKRHQSSFLEKIIIGSETRRMAELFEGNLLIIPP